MTEKELTERNNQMSENRISDRQPSHKQREAAQKTVDAVAALAAYEVTDTRWIEELHSQALICRHKKSGARLFLLSNDDNNKVFAIGFRTPPMDSTGVPHILEHSVLCGSRKFPAKDPFVELVKGSLNTFLNAMTYPDKTLYPIASCNDKDFQNLMDVYMDAVLHPNICENEKIFRQEGWHYEINGEEEPITINGVVYNEMIGEYSQPENMLDARIRQVLFPDTCYGYDSGGDPDYIPKLSYEGFQNFYHRYYHPSNSYIYLYGDMNMEEKLRWLDEEYLCQYDRQPVDSRITMQEPFAAMADRTFYYPLTDDEDEENQTYLSINRVVGTDLDRELYVAFQILEYALLTAPGAPLKQALLDAGIGKDVMGGYESGILQPYFSVVVKNASPQQKEAFVQTVDGELRRLAKEGLDRKSLLAALNYYEFKYREADYGQFPKGLMYGLQCFDSWLYDESDPLMHLAYAQTFEQLRGKVDTGYFEELITKYLLDNPHSALVTAQPKKGLSAEREEALKREMAEFKASLDAGEIARLIRETAELKAYQEEPTDPEILRKIPMLTREDIGREVLPFTWKESHLGGATVLHHDIFTSGIGYLRLLFDTAAVEDEDLPYLGLLRSVLGYMNTEGYDYRELFNEIHIHSGGIATNLNTYADSENPDSYRAMFEFSAKTFYDKLDFVFDMIAEMATKTVFDDKKRLRELIAENKSRAQMRLLSSGHSAAVSRASSYYSQAACLGDITGGISYYKFIEDLDAHFDERAQETIGRLEKLTRQIFTPDRLLVSYTADEEGFSGLEEPLSAFIERLYPGGQADAGRFLVPVKKNEGFMTSSGVQYVAQCGSFRRAGYAYTGALKILKMILSYDYLWIQLRVKGGAYGCMSGFSRSGDGYFASYRDPHLKSTLEVYRGVPDYLRSFAADEREMTKYIIGTISDMDVPLTPSARGARSLAAYLCHVTEEMIQRERDQVVTAQPEDIRALAPLVEAILSDECICVIGGAGKCREDGGELMELCNLFE